MGVGFRLKRFKRMAPVSASSLDKRERLRDALSLAGCSRLLWLALFVCLGLVAETPDARAQIPEMNRGFSPNSTFATSGIDTVNLFNGNLVLSIPLGPDYPIGADFSHQLRLVYNSQLWRSAFACYRPDEDRDYFGVYVAGSPVVGAGWTLEMGHLQEPELDSVGSEAFHYFSPDGSSSPFFGPVAGVYRTTNTMYLRARNVQFTGRLITNAEVDFPNGDRGFFTRRIAVAHGSTRNDFNADGLYLTRLENRFGDAIEVNYEFNYEVADGTWRTANIKHYSQGVFLRQITFHYTLVTVSVGPDTWAVVSSIDFPSVSGTQQVLLNYSLTGFGRPGRDITDLACLNPAERSRTLTAAPLLASVQLDATQPALTYSFDYFRQIDPRPGNNAGVVTQLLLPAGGGVRYQWGFFPAGALEPLTPYCNPADRGCRLRFRRQNMVPLTQRTEYPEGFGGPAHIWMYRQNRFIWPPPFSQRTEVEAPDGYKVQHFFHIEPDEYANLPSNGLEYQTDFLDAAGNPIRRSRFCYESDQYGSNLCGPSVDFFWLGANVRQSYTDVTAIGSPSQTKKVQRSFWDGFGHFGREDFYDWDGTTLRRSVITQWNPNTSDWLLDLFDSRSEIEGGRVDQYFYFDRATGFLKGSVTGDPSPPSRILGTCRYSDGAGNAAQEVSAIAEFALPPPVNPCPANFADWPGGVIGLNNDAFGKQNAYQHGLLTSSRWIQDRSPIGWAMVNQARNPQTGLVTTSWDTANVPTSFGYDILGRLTSVAPSEEAPGVISYDSPTQTTVTRSGADGNSTWERSLYDGFGRLTREIRQLPSGFSVRLRRYDSVGRVFFLSEWASCSDPASCAAIVSIPGTTSSNFDPFGRPQFIARADGSTTAISYTDGSIPFSDTQKTITLNNVNGTCGGGSCVGGVSAATTYRYDIFGRILSVTEPDGAPTTYAYEVNDKLTFLSQPPSQSRSFSYNPFGFLRSETTPEKGTVSYSFYGSLGNLLEKTEGGILHTYSYDAAGRLLSEFAGGTQYLSNFYDAAGFTGKLTRRVGFNPLSNPPGTVTEDFAYSGRGGRLSQKTVSLTGAPAIVPAAIQTWNYNTLGLLATHGHPKVGGSPDILSTLTYTSGFPVGLSANGQPLLSTAAYNPSGGLASWTAGNSIVTTIAQDPSLLPRPSQIFTSAGGFNTGAYTYDGAGNIKAMGDDGFTYDIHSRLSSSAVSGQSRSYPYDRYGNLNPATVNPANNQFWAGSYDGMGNLTAFAGRNYAYDALSRQTSLDSGAERYLYDGGNERIAKMALLPPPNDSDFVPEQSVLPPTTMITGQTYPVSITMRNAGTNTWEERPPPYPPFPHRLGTLYSGIWGVDRVFLNPGEQIPPGQTRTFFFNVTAPSIPGTYSFQWQMLQELIEWFGNRAPALPREITVTLPPNAAAFVSRSFPNPMQAGSRYWVSVSMRNTGSATWTAAANYKLGSQAPGDPFGSRVLLQPADSIATGQTKTFTFTVTAPATPGAYTFRWQMVQEGIEWFGDLTPLDSISVVDDPGTTADFHSVPGCRLLDTRGGPPLTAGVPRNLQTTGSCAVPAGATAVSGSLVVLETTHTGVMQIWPTHLSPGDASFQNLTAGMLRANNFVVGLSPAGQFSVVAYLPQTGTTHIIVDISGYFRPPGVSSEEGFPSPTIPLPPVCPQCDRTGTVPDDTTPQTQIAATGPVETWNMGFRDEGNRLSTDYTVRATSILRMKDYFYFGSLLVATWDAALGYRYYASDHLGTPRLVTNQSGGVAEEHTYHPFGEEIGRTFGNQPLKFAAMERDPSSNSDYDHARYCSPLQGRFLSPDILGGNIGEPQSLNRYGYALNNPLKYMDPNGEFPVLAVAVVLGAGAVQGGFRAIDFALSRSDATAGDYLREFGIGFGSGVAAATAGIFAALGTGNPFIIGAAVGETDALATQWLEIRTGQRTSLDPADIALKTGAGALLGNVANVVTPRLRGGPPKYFRSRPVSDLFLRPNVNRELRAGLVDAFIGSRGFAAVDTLRSPAGPTFGYSYGPGYFNFQLFLRDYHRMKYPHLYGGFYGAIALLPLR